MDITSINKSSSGKVVGRDQRPCGGVEIVLPWGMKARAQPDPTAATITKVRTVVGDILI